MPTVFVTVGTTSFDDLIKKIISNDLLQTLASKGYSQLILQIGKGSYEPSLSSFGNMKISWFRFKDFISTDISEADLVISHAGAGTCLEVLNANKPLVVVINDTLMGNHQVELAKQLADDSHLFYTTVSGLKDTLQTANFQSLRPFASGKPQLFANFLNGVMGVSS